MRRLDILVITALLAAAITMGSACSRTSDEDDAANPDAPVFSGLAKALATSATTVELTWRPATDDDTATDAIRYRIEYAEGGADALAAAAALTTAPGATEATIDGLTAGAVYNFRVRALDANGDSDENDAVLAVRMTEAVPLGSAAGLATESGAWGDEPSLAFRSGVVYAAWTEVIEGQDVARTVTAAYSGGAWGTLETIEEQPARNTKEATVAFQGATQYVIWSEIQLVGAEMSDGAVYVKRRSGTDPFGTPLGGDLALPAAGALSSIAEVGHTPNVIPITPHVAFRQFDTDGRGQIFVKRWNNNTQEWELLAGDNALDSLNVDPVRGAGLPVLAYLGNAPCVTWVEGADLYVKQWNEADDAWVVLDGPINIGTAKHHPWLASGNDTLYVSWHEETDSVDLAYVARLDGDAWTVLGGPLNLDPQADSAGVRVAVADGTPYALWVERDDAGRELLFIKEWDGERWILNGRSLNVNDALRSNEPFLGTFGGSVYAAWAEGMTGARVYVATLQ